MPQPDPALVPALAELARQRAAAPKPPVGDVAGRRGDESESIALLRMVIPPAPAVTRTDSSVTSYDGAEISVWWYQPETPATAALVHIHGGGMIAGTMDRHDPVVAHYVNSTGVAMLAVDYRLAPEFPHPTPVEDCYAALQWLHANAQRLGISPDHIGVIGDSAGGGLAAALTLLARERGGPAISRQILIYPMLDDRNIEPDPNIEPYALWTAADNETGWGALVGSDRRGGPDVPAIAAPARADDLTGLPPAYVEVGELDIFRSEDIDYARRLLDAGVTVELSVVPGMIHAYEYFAPQAAATARAYEARFRNIRAT